MNTQFKHKFKLNSNLLIAMRIIERKPVKKTTLLREKVKVIFAKIKLNTKKSTIYSK